MIPRELAAATCPIAPAGRCRSPDPGIYFLISEKDTPDMLTFAYYSRRARQEQLAAINSATPAAAAAHESLSRLCATQALRALLHGP